MAYGTIIIEIGEIIGNAFISCLEQKRKRTLSFEKINEYSIKVVEQLNEKGERARLNLSREADEEFFYKYSKWFKRVTTENEIIIILDDSVTIMELFKEFSAYLSFEVLLVFKDPENTKVLFE